MRLSTLSLWLLTWIGLAGSVSAQTRNWAGFRCAQDPGAGPAAVDFPSDFGAHYDYSLEWWYYTGNLKTVDGQDVGFHLTVVRRGLLPMPGAQAWMGNLAITAPHIGKGFYYTERYNVGPFNVITRSEPFQVALSSGSLWNMQVVDGVPGYQGASFLLQGDANDQDTLTPLGLFLKVVDQKGAVLQGNKGYSRKGEQDCNASYYFSQTRLEVEADNPNQYLQVGDEKMQIASGTIWMDHEYSTSFMPHPGGGWDWFSVKLEDQSELMFFHLRKSKNPYDYDPMLSAGSYIDQAGNITHLSEKDFSIDVKGTWRSPKTGVRYPSGWAVSLPNLGLELDIKPLVKNQELASPINDYWEGATLVKGQRNGEPVRGAGYGELVGYGKTFFLP